MFTEVLVYADDAAAVRDELSTNGGRLIHALTPHLLVISIPESMTVGSLRSAEAADPARLEGMERRLADAWLTRFGAASRQADRLARADRPPIPWDAPGFTPPDHLPGRPGPDALVSDLRWPHPETSVLLTGSVAVGLVMVSGPADPPAWMPMHGVLKYVSVSADGTVWGVNRNDEIFRFNGSTWDAISGRLAQISVGSARVVWGVNAAGEIFSWTGNGWMQIAGALKHVAAGSDGTVWGVNRNDEIFRFNGSSWDQISGRLAQISVGSAAAVWGVNADGTIYSWNGNGWTQVPGSLKHVSVASDGSVFGVNRDDEIFSRTPTAWEQLPGRLEQISVGSASSIWGVNKDDEIYRRQPGFSLAFSDAEKSLIMSEVLEGLTFLGTLDPVANVSFVQDWRDVSVDVAPSAGHDYEDFEGPWRNAALKAMGFDASRDGSFDFVNALRASQQTDWAYVAYFTKYPLHHFAYASKERLVIDYNNDNWGPSDINRVFAHETCHLFGAADEYGDCTCDSSGHFDIPNNNCVQCAQQAQIPCLMSANTLFLCAWSRGQVGWSPWELLAGSLKYASVGADGAVWGVNGNDEIFRWNGSAWDQVPGSLKQISVGDTANISGVNRNDEVFTWSGSHWTQISGALKHVAIAADGTLWGVNKDDKIFRRNGSTWDQVAGRLRQIGVGNAASIWGTNAGDEIFTWNGSDWTQVAGALTHVSASADGTVWGVNRNDEIYRYDPGSSVNLWVQVPGALKQISVGAANLAWGVNRNDSIFRLR